MKKIKPGILFLCFLQLAVFCMCKNEADKKSTGNTSTVSASDSSTQDGTMNKEFFDKAIATLKSGEVLDSVTLKNILPQKIVGLTRTSLMSRKTEQAGMTVATTEATFKNENKKLNIKIIDAGLNSAFIHSEAPWTGIEFRNSRADGYENSFVVDGNSIQETYDSGTKQASLTVNYNDRILINLLGVDFTMDELYTAIR